MRNQKIVKITRFLTMTSTVDYESYRKHAEDADGAPRLMTEDEIREFEINIDPEEFIDRVLVESDNEPEQFDMATRVTFEEA